jgi:hypothetical protein
VRPHGVSPVVRFCLTAAFLLSTHQLSLDGGYLWDDEWFKDEGGRDKCITLKVTLRDARNKVVTDRRVPLTVTLLYSNDVQVLWGSAAIFVRLLCDLFCRARWRARTY